MGPDLSVSEEKLDVASSFHTTCPFAGGDIYGDIMPQTFLFVSMCIFLLFVQCQSNSVSFWITFRRHCFVSSFRISLWAKVSSGSYLVTMLNKASFALKKTFSFLRLLCYL